MGKPLLVVDIEATCWDTDNPQETSEIIQVGMCALHNESSDANDFIPGVIQKLWSPDVQAPTSKVSQFCTELTGITQERVNAGAHFGVVCDYMVEKLGTRELVWASYGDYDRKMFESQCATWGIRYPFSNIHINVKKLAQHILGKRLGMAQALQACGLTLEGRHHDGADDAYNIAKLVKHLLSGENGRSTRKHLGLA